MNDSADREVRGSGAAPDGSAPYLVGRERESALLSSQLTSALEGRGGLVLLSGEAGIGKTVLSEAVCREAMRAGALVLNAHCYDGSETPPYGPWLEILDQYRGLANRPSAQRVAAEPSLTQGSSQPALFAEMRDFLVAIAREHPLVVVLDDMHWADSESFELLRFIARKLTSEPMLVLVNYRNDEVARGHPLHRLAPVFVREALAVRIDLSPLRYGDVCALIQHRYRLPLEDEERLAQYVHQRSEGNPFFVSELLRTLEGTALEPDASGAWHLGPLAQPRVPLLLQQVIDHRLSKLGTDAERLLEVAAVIGPVVPLALWATISGESEAGLLQLVERAIDAHVMEAAADGLSVSFSHALIREAIYERILPPRRRIWQREIGDALIARGGTLDPDEIGYRFVQAGDPRAALWLTRAGERAQRAFAWRTAGQRFDAALAQLGADDIAENQKGWLHLRIALLRRFEEPVAGVAQLEEAERLGRSTNDLALVAFARFNQGMLRCMGDDFRRGIAAEEAGIALLDALTPEDRARLATIETTGDPLDSLNGRGELTLALAGNGRLTQARELGEYVIGLPLEQTNGSLGDAWYGLGYAYAALGQPAEAARAFARAREIFIADDNRGMVTASLFDELLLLVAPYWIDQPRRRERAEDALRASLAGLTEHAEPVSNRIANVLSDILNGEWADALAALDRNHLRFIRRTIPTLLAPLARHQGNTALAWSLIHESFPAGPETEPEDCAVETVPLRSLAVKLSLDEGQPEMARRWLESFDCWLDWSRSVLGRADAQLGWASYERTMGNHAAARSRAEFALTAAQTPRQPMALLASHRFLGECDLAVGEFGGADAHFAAALALAVATGSAHERALTLLAQAELRLKQGELVAARALIEIARALCRPMNAALTLAQIDRLDARLPAEPSVAPNALTAGLTPREADVLRLLATGLSNAEIAERLFLSSRTVDTHLTSIYGKFGVTSRGAAIRFALDHDLS
jgi:DNA-binding CsgD family transcriptional regulator